MPINCPPDATSYDFLGTAWIADLGSIPDAHWIWAPGVHGGDISELVKFTFVREFQLGAAPSGYITLGVDNYARVLVNGILVGELGSIQNPIFESFNQLTTFDLTPALKAGMNTVSIFAANGVTDIAPNCSYTCNPAGLVFGGTLTSVTTR
ncbi:MAG TPA: hypothetical protein VFQ61_03325 [Polyangiaceae bacterium]|nr:hypothetical protein [Polyangiaceae bacterium]